MFLNGGWDVLKCELVAGGKRVFTSGLFWDNRGSDSERINRTFNWKDVESYSHTFGFNRKHQSPLYWTVNSQIVIVFHSSCRTRIEICGESSYKIRELDSTSWKTASCGFSTFNIKSKTSSEPPSTIIRLICVRFIHRIKLSSSILLFHSFDTIIYGLYHFFKKYCTYNSLDRKRWRIRFV